MSKIREAIKQAMQTTSPEDLKVAKINFEMMIGKPHEADEALGTAYRAIINFKLGMDSMEEIPNSLKPHYKQAMKAIDAITKAQEESYQLRMMVTRLPR